MKTSVVEMVTEAGAEALIAQMGKRLGTKTRSKVIEKTLRLIQQDFHISEVTQWFSEPRFAPTNRTTVRLSEDTASFAAALASSVNRGRPIVLMELVYFAAANLSRDDLDSAA